MKILQLSVHFAPNIGGVETHLSDLCKILSKRGFKVIVLTYRPLETEVSWQILEQKQNLTIIRIPWIPKLFYKFVNMPVLEFLYLAPGLFLATPLVLLFKRIEVIHAHGLVAGFVGAFWSKVFKKKLVISTHSIYGFPKKGIYRKLIIWIFRSASFCLGLSKQAAAEIRSLGISKHKVKSFTYWIDLNKFKKVKDAKTQLGWKNNFIVSFVGRLVPGKGIEQLLESVEGWDKKINLKIIGEGPLQEDVNKSMKKYKNIDLIGAIDQDVLPLYYSGSDILIVPSTAQEGFGRVILESLSCGTPVVGSNKGGISEAIDSSVGKLIEVSPNNIKEAVEFFYNNKTDLEKLAKNCRDFAERNFSEKNADTIIESYKK